MYTDIFTLKQTIIEAGEITALAVIKQLDPSFDDVKYTEAIKLAGSKKWLDYHIKRGHITKVRRGAAKNSPFYCSRLEIAAVKKAEAAQASILEQTNSRT